MDWLSDLSDPAPIAEPLRVVKTHLNHEVFLIDRYVWDGWSSENYGQCRVDLSQGYFTFIDATVVDLVSDRSWHANIQRDPHTGKILKVYAVATIQGKKVTLHRLVTDAGKGVIVDHFNGLSLDNRRCNLRATTQAINVAGAIGRKRSRHSDLNSFRGVEIRGKGRFGWELKFHKKTYRSKQTWDTAKGAHDAYLEEHKKFFGHSCVDVAVAHKSYPIFPPTYQEAEEGTYIPF
ncbi:hypothetical protein HZC00_04450 [Candidatus Kaiserbacteria bacterium]|nr:hypothetical protein [Candidatus Kaiserbacteria bacterium]